MSSGQEIFELLVMLCGMAFFWVVLPWLIRMFGGK